MHNCQKSPGAMAIFSSRKAFSYLIFSFLILIVSLGLTTWLWFGLNQNPNSRFIQENSHPNGFTVFFVGIGMLSASLISMTIAHRQFQLARRLEMDGHLIHGTITNKWEDTFDGRLLYYVSYCFQEESETWQCISQNLYNVLDKGRDVPIRYLKQEPSISRMDCEQIIAG